MEADDEIKRYAASFLKEFKALLLEGRFFVKNRLVNRKALVDLGLTERQREEEILSLSVLDYSSGPITDEYQPSVYWVFGRNINGKLVYIKLKIACNRYDEKAVCMSFHEAEYPMEFPFK